MSLHATRLASKLSCIVILTATSIACLKKKPEEQEYELQGSRPMDVIEASGKKDTTEEKENSIDEISLPVFSDEGNVILNYLVNGTPWVNVDYSDDKFSLKLEDGFYRLTGLEARKKMYVSEVPEADFEAATYLISFSDPASDFKICYQFEILETQPPSITVTYFDNCTTGYEATSYVSESNFDPELAEPELERRELKFKYVGYVEGSLTINMEDKNGNLVSFRNIDISGFDFNDNPYFEVDTAGGFAITQYKLKEGIADRWFYVGWREKEEEVDSELSTTVGIIKEINQPG